VLYFKTSMNQTENQNETLFADFPILTDENQKSVIDMAKFLVLTQNTIIPEIINPKNEEKKEGLG